MLSNHLKIMNVVIILSKVIKLDFIIISLHMGIMDNLFNFM